MLACSILSFEEDSPWLINYLNDKFHPTEPCTFLLTSLDHHISFANDSKVLMVLSFD